MKQKIIQLLDKLSSNQLEKLYKDLNRKTCEHLQLKTPRRQDLEDESAEAECIDCGKHLGWWCPENPHDHVCYYESQGDKSGRFIMVHGKRVEVESDPKFENEDRCIFCQEPQERK